MAKYYIKCGRIRTLTNGRSREEAVHRAIHQAVRSGDGRFLPIRGLQRFGLVTTVSERGFLDTKATYYYLTHVILAEVGPFAEFNYEREEE